MGLTKQARILSRSQTKAVISFIEHNTRYPLRNKLIFLLSVKAGLRAKEISELQFYHVCDAELQISDTIILDNQTSKGSNGGREIPMNKSLQEVLIQYHAAMRPRCSSCHLFRSERGNHMKPKVIGNFFKDLYQNIGLQGCSSHSGRRTFITNAARNIGTVGGSLRDVQILAGHQNLGTTQRYIERNTDAQRKIVDVV